MTGSAAPGAAPPVRVLVVIACPTDAQTFDAAGAWTDFADAMRPLVSQNLVTIERLTPPTENAVRKKLADRACQALHFIGHVSWRQAAQYGTVVLENSSGTSRGLGTQYFTDLLTQHALDLAVLATPQAPQRLDRAIPPFGERGPAVVLASGLTSRAHAIFAVKLYAALATGSSVEDAVSHARQAIPDALGAGAAVVLCARWPAAQLVAAAEKAAVGTSASPTADAPQQPAVDARAARAAADAAAAEAARLVKRRELQRKRAASEFDVFLCHNVADKPAVIEIADRLESQGILPWLDQRELPPGQPWQPLLERQIANIKSAAVFVGAAGVGPWQEQEIWGLLNEFARRRNPVIPVMLRDAPEKPELPIFLRAMTWVDFRVADPDPLARLIWGITGTRPADS